MIKTFEFILFLVLPFACLAYLKMWLDIADKILK